MKNSMLCLTALLSIISLETMAINKVVYGVDNRIDISESSKTFLLDSVAAMIPSDLIKNDHKGKVEDTQLSRYSTLKTYQGYPTCSDIKFRSEPTIALCSGFLIGENLLMTAGHCMVPRGKTVKNEVTDACKSNKWVFNYTVKKIVKNGKLKISKKEVYGCKKVVSGSWTASLDYSIIELDRTAADKKPVTLINPLRKVLPLESIYVAGHPTGLPMKVSDNAYVTHINSITNEFSTNLDTFAGNSGSPVFNNNDEVVGILVSGEIDYAYDYDKECYDVNYCKGYGQSCDRQTNPYGAVGESVTKIEAALKHYNSQVMSSK